MQRTDQIQLISETPELYASEAMQGYVAQEHARREKEWIHDIVKLGAEAECVKERTEEFVLLPDVGVHRRTLRAYKMLPGRAGRAVPEQEPLYSTVRRLAHAWAPRYTYHRFHWLAIVTDDGLRSIRDLRAHHAPMLLRMRDRCLGAIRRDHSIQEEDIMIFANYHPSVYRLHFHFCAPFFQPSPFDAFRIHSLSSILNNLRIHPEYYALSTLQIPVHLNSLLYRALVANAEPALGPADAAPELTCNLNEEADPCVFGARARPRSARAPI